MAEVFTEYLLQNWGVILILLAFAVVLKITVFLDKITVRRMYILIALVFVFSFIVFNEFYLAEINKYPQLRAVLIAIRYSTTPFVIAFILYTLVKKVRWYYVFSLAAIFAILNIISIFTGIVFSINEAGDMVRGPLGYFPYIAVGIYSVALVYFLFRQSSKLATEIIPIIFLAFAFGSGLVLPFIVGKDYSKIFCLSIAIALFVYYVFLILQLTKKDALTGLLNRQAYYAFIKSHQKDISAVVSIDMNGLKSINDNEGHLAGDEALTTLARCFTKAATSKQLVYRIGGDEFVILCRNTSEKELKSFIERIQKNVGKTKYRCSIGYCYSSEEDKDLEEMVKESDVMMYADKAKYYEETGLDRRNK